MTADLVRRTTLDPELAALFVQVFDDYRSTHGPAGPERDFDPDLWATLAELGLTRLTAPEAEGGSGATWAEAAALLAAAAGAAAPVPLAENDLLAGWLLRVAGAPATDTRVRTAAWFDTSAGGSVHPVPYARDAGSIVLLTRRDGGTYVSELSAGDLTVVRARSRSGEPRDLVDLAAAANSSLRTATAVPDRTWAEFRLRGALARSAQIVGGMERVLEVVLQHAAVRVQFGRPLAKFQAVQNLISDIAGEAALARAAVDAAVVRVALSDWADPGTEFFVAAAASCTGHAATTVVRNGHQVVAAIGTTTEHELHTLTLPILDRRGEFGSIRSWDERLTALAGAAGDRLWTLVTTGVTG